MIIFIRGLRYMYTKFFNSFYIPLPSLLFHPSFLVSFPLAKDFLNLQFASSVYCSDEKVLTSDFHFLSSEL